MQISAILFEAAVLPVWDCALSKKYQLEMRGKAQRVAHPA